MRTDRACEIVSFSEVPRRFVVGSLDDFAEVVVLEVSRLVFVVDGEGRKAFYILRADWPRHSQPDVLGLD